MAMPDMKERLNGISKIVYHNGAFFHSQLLHEELVKDMTMYLGRRLGLDEHDLHVAAMYGRDHDDGHIPYAHHTEGMLRYYCGFDHEEFAMELIKGSAGPDYPVEEVLACFRQENPLHALVDGPFGTDRIAYMVMDQLNTMARYGFSPREMLEHLQYSDGILAADDPDLALDFLVTRARLYGRIYFADEALSKKELARKAMQAAGIRCHTSSIGGKPLWQWTDSELTDQLAARHPWFHRYNETDNHVRVAYIGCVEPLYNLNAEIIDYSTLRTLLDTVKRPQVLASLEKSISQDMGIDQQDILVTALDPHRRLRAEPAPVLANGSIKDLAEVRPHYAILMEMASRRSTFIKCLAHRSVAYEVAHHLKEHPLLDYVLAVQD